MSYVLAIETHDEQAGVLRNDIGGRARTKLRVVDDIDEAITAIDYEVPKLVLIGALMNPRDEEHLMARLRAVPRGNAPQVLIIPPLVQRPRPVAVKRSLFGRARREPFWPVPCDPSVFASHLCEYLGEPSRAGADRRAARRIEQVDWARVVVNDTAVDLIDLSPVGAQIRSSVLLQPGGSVRVMVSREELDAIRCEAGIVWNVTESTGSRRSRRYRAGITFKGIDQSSLERLYLRGLGAAATSDTSNNP